MEYLINFGDKKIALSRTDIANLYPALEPHFLAIMQGLNEIETLQFVKEYKMFTDSLTKELKKGPLTEDGEEPIITEITDTDEEEKPSKSAEVYDFNTRRKII